MSWPEAVQRIWVDAPDALVTGMAVLLFLLLALLIWRMPAIVAASRWGAPVAALPAPMAPPPSAGPALPAPDWGGGGDEAAAVNELLQHKTVLLLRQVEAESRTACIMIDLKGQILFLNPPAERLTGYDEAELTGVSVSILMEPPHSVAHERYIEDYLDRLDRGEASRVVGKIRRVHLRRRDGSTVPVELAVTAVQNGVRGFLGRLYPLEDDR